VHVAAGEESSHTRVGALDLRPPKVGRSDHDSGKLKTLTRRNYSTLSAWAEKHEVGGRKAFV